MSTRPEVGTSNPASSASKVVLPEPEAPRIATASPRSISKEMSLRMVRAELPVNTCFVKPAALTIGGMNLSAIRLLLFVLMLVIVPVSLGATQTILVFGDSISAGYGLAQGESWVALLEQRIKRDNLDYQVVNASISGETTLGGRNRIAGALQQYRPAVVIVALGGNDGLRGNPLEETRRNLIAIVETCRKKGENVLIEGRHFPQNCGPVTARRFEGLFA